MWVALDVLLGVRNASASERLTQKRNNLVEDSFIVIVVSSRNGRGERQARSDAMTKNHDRRQADKEKK
jgi:hypothetical protein